MYRVFKHTFFHPRRCTLTLLLSFFIFMVLQIIPVWRFIKISYVLSDKDFSWYVEILYQYIFEPFTYISFLQQIIIISLSVAIAVNIFLFIAYVKRQKRMFAGKSFVGTVLGIFFGLFGVGCVSCGALVLAPVLTVIGLGSFVQQVAEYSTTLSLVGLGMVIFSICYLLRILSKPLICK